MAKEKEQEISFEYIKSNSFKVVRVDGAHGSVSPHGDSIQMAFFSERFPIPKKEVFRLGGDGKVGECINKEQRKSVIREVEVEGMVTITAAKAIHTWLGEKIKEAEKIHALNAVNND